jgi:hypothetical protein
MSEDDFLKVKISIIPKTLYEKPEYFDDDGKLIIRNFILKY